MFQLSGDLICLQQFSFYVRLLSYEKDSTLNLTYIDKFQFPVISIPSLKVHSSTSPLTPHLHLFELIVFNYSKKIHFPNENYGDR